MPNLINEFDSSVAEEMALAIGPAGMDIAYQRFGNPDAPAVLLIMGVAAQLIHWPDDFCNALVSRGLQVIRFDNRDAGRSTHLKGAPAPDLTAIMNGDLSSAVYTLSDMAADALGLLDFLSIRQAHVVGASMGGQIAQTLAIENPARVRSLTSMMSSTGNMRVGFPAAEVLREVFSGPPAVTREEVIHQMLRAVRILGSPAYPCAASEVAARAGRAYDRGYDSRGFARQGAATLASGDRTEHLRQLKIPSLVIHGLADRMCDVSGGRATAEAIPGARLILVEGMGHDLAPALRPQLAGYIAEFILQVERAATS
ncbi:MAG: alpha/beta hydrolase [Bryobacterales bacterium]|nr:alpha/beta hydrolase [Bryobacterales bacterium]